MANYILQFLHLGKKGRRVFCTKGELCLQLCRFPASHDPSTLANGIVDTKICIETYTAWYRWLC
jgi:hypothetical protein